MNILTVAFVWLGWPVGAWCVGAPKDSSVLPPVTFVGLCRTIISIRFMSSLTPELAVGKMDTALRQTTSMMALAAVI